MCVIAIFSHNACRLGIELPLILQAIYLHYVHNHTTIWLHRMNDSFEVSPQNHLQHSHPLHMIKFWLCSRQGGPSRIIVGFNWKSSQWILASKLDQVWAINKIMPQNETICATTEIQCFTFPTWFAPSGRTHDGAYQSGLVAILNDEGCGDCRRQKQSFQSDSVGGVPLEALFGLSVPRFVVVGHRWKLIVFALLRHNVSMWNVFRGISTTRRIEGNKPPASKQFQFIILLCHKIGRFT